MRYINYKEEHEMRVNFFFGKESKVCIFNFSQLRLISKVTMLIGFLFYNENWAKNRRRGLANSVAANT